MVVQFDDPIQEPIEIKPKKTRKKKVKEVIPLTFKPGTRLLFDSGGVIFHGRVASHPCFKCHSTSIAVGLVVEPSDKTPLKDRNYFPMRVCYNGCGYTANDILNGDAGFK